MQDTISYEDAIAMGKLLLAFGHVTRLTQHFLGNVCRSDHDGFTYDISILQGSATVVRCSVSCPAGSAIGLLNAALTVLEGVTE